MKNLKLAINCCVILSLSIIGIQKIKAFSIQESANSYNYIAPPKKTIKKTQISFQVEGTCGMCKDRIEKALDKKGVYKAIYDVKSKNLTVIYDPRKLEEIQIHNMVAMVGHDTPLVKASDVVYQNLPDCCRYREGAQCEDGF